MLRQLHEVHPRRSWLHRRQFRRSARRDHSRANTVRHRIAGLGPIAEAGFVAAELIDRAVAAVEDRGELLATPHGGRLFDGGFQVSRALHALGHRVLAIDSSLTMSRAAAAYPVGPVPAVVADAARLPLASGRLGRRPEQRGKKKLGPRARRPVPARMSGERLSPVLLERRRYTEQCLPQTLPNGEHHDKIYFSKYARIWSCEPDACRCARTRETRPRGSLLPSGDVSRSRSSHRSHLSWLRLAVAEHVAVGDYFWHPRRYTAKDGRRKSARPATSI